MTPRFERRSLKKTSAFPVNEEGLLDQKPKQKKQKFKRIRSETPSNKSGNMKQSKPRLVVPQKHGEAESSEESKSFCEFKSVIVK
mmetsp:Transcript_17385/g.20181  ORF Transcript_17385/g.20181 Transcript_17385/m.20181 type:complete len:85 (+) Transcript_17385:421-675(+)